MKFKKRNYQGMPVEDSSEFLIFYSDDENITSKFVSFFNGNNRNTSVYPTSNWVDFCDCFSRFNPQTAIIDFTNKSGLLYELQEIIAKNGEVKILSIVNENIEHTELAKLIIISQGILSINAIENELEDAYRSVVYNLKYVCESMLRVWNIITNS
ncbi:MAG: hypothetical protein K9J16_09540 [Melioribacteraceae bacterium]|nr:hypothetical protein [Melioribacteraceae bacterium]MCF8355398.1 hypothetical protein [Melioribacteraceae bacterium]MCF8394643.1 hypothetical protein [Melioribacteraceae bacterium]MCF8419640.1 hypothetical protein [Melioribacteraceae bacterium]